MQKIMKVQIRSGYTRSERSKKVMKVAKTFVPHFAISSLLLQGEFGDDLKAFISQWGDLIVSIVLILVAIKGAIALAGVASEAFNDYKEKRKGGQVTWEQVKEMAKVDFGISGIIALLMVVPAAVWFNRQIFINIGNRIVRALEDLG